MPARRQADLWHAVALIVQTRDYPRAEILTTLVDRGFLTSECDYSAETVKLIADVRPQLLVAALDPAREDDLAMVRELVDLGTADVIALVASGEPALLATVLNAGADAVVREADGPEVLGAQIDALARRRTKSQAEGRALRHMTVQDLVVDFDRQQVMRAGKSITLARVEFQLLAMPARNSGKVVGCVDIVRAIHGYTCSEAEAQGFVKVYVARIRKKLDDDTRSPRYIVNVRGAGYLLERRMPGAANGASEVADEPPAAERLG